MARWRVQGQRENSEPGAICIIMTNPEATNKTFIFFTYVLLPFSAPYVIQGTLKKAQMEKLECN